MGLTSGRVVEATLHLTDEVTGEIWRVMFVRNIVRSPGKMFNVLAVLKYILREYSFPQVKSHIEHFSGRPIRVHTTLENPSGERKTNRFLSSHTHTIQPWGLNTYEPCHQI